MKDYFVLGLKNLKRRGIRSWLTLLGIFIGIMAVISLISLGTALKDTVNSQFGVSSTEVISIQAGGLNSYGPPGSGAVERLTKDDVEAIEDLSTIELAIGRNIETFRMEFNDIVDFPAGFGVSSGEKRKFDYEMQDIEAFKGRLLEDGDNYKAILGNNYLDKDKSGFGKALKVGDKILLNDIEFRVVGILEKKGSFILDNVVAINENDLEDITDNGDYVDVIGAMVKDKDLMGKAKEDIEKLLRKRRDVKMGEENFEVSTPEATLNSVNQVLTGIQIFIVIIASISIFVGAIGITNTMTTSVLERKKEIGIMKAIGARNEDIFWQFFIEAGLMGFVGGVLGIFAGMGVGYVGVNAINDFIGATTKLNVDFIFMGLILCMSFLVGCLSGTIPAMNASKLNPVEALRE